VSEFVAPRIGGIVHYLLCTSLQCTLLLVLLEMYGPGTGGGGKGGGGDYGKGGGGDYGKGGGGRGGGGRERQMTVSV
jgi:hypothetical protein